MILILVLKVCNKSNIPKAYNPKSNFYIPTVTFSDFSSNTQRFDPGFIIWHSQTYENYQGRDIGGYFSRII
jgi:hypothetical protein